ncbi:Mannose-6-phosphate isomerase ManA [termite gut metagenome]|uniref:Mannose-6-phosphate isomerase ManA n=1 Tax=termite gut metagenome TaxID=433724 RepID=A0A5J4SAK2_9ZZZZ
MDIINYDKLPFTSVEGSVYKGWNKIEHIINKRYKQLADNKFILSVETYQGVYHEELIAGFNQLQPELFVDTKELFLSEDSIRSKTHPDVTDDRIFGYMTRLSFADLLNWEKVSMLRSRLEKAEGLIVVYGYAASLLVEKPDLLIYADMARWEIQLRQRLHKVDNIGINNRNEETASQYKRGFFVDWRICDKQKKSLFAKTDYWLDTNEKDNPKMIETSVLLAGLNKMAETPFRVVPFFDPGPWGGQWMKKKLGLNPNQKNYAWCFDCVPEENSLLLKVQNEIIEIPAINLVFYKTKELLGEAVESRFGQEFPIRFDFLDTIDGGNLSLQVHPTTQYIQDQFGMKYTQDESYYMLDSKEDAFVYLGLKKGISPCEMIHDLNLAQEGCLVFDADKYINRFPAKKHDHFLIPNGTVHCSGANGMVLEVSATPYIFTFKLWDWERLGLDGKPRPINIRHGANVIQWNRDTDWCEREIVNRIEKIADGDGWREEKTGLHKNEFIETRRHWFTKPVLHHTSGSVNVINLVEGEEAIVESPGNDFPPFVVHYAETFIVPEAVGEYTIRPYGKSTGKECATLKAFVRLNA